MLACNQQTVVLAKDWKDVFTGWSSAMGCFQALNCWTWLLLSQMQWPCECGRGGQGIAAWTLGLCVLGAPCRSCRWLFVTVVWSVQLLCLQALLKPTEFLLPRLFWHCFSLLLVLPGYLLYAATCLPTCFESSVLHSCQHKEPAWVNCCLLLYAWARFLLNPRTV